MFCKEVEGKYYWLKIGVVRIQHTVGGIDATNVYPDDKVYYRAKFGGFRQMQSSSAEDFAEEARVKAQTASVKGWTVSHVRLWEKGSKVKIHKMKAKWMEIRCDITEEGGSKSRIRFKFEKDMDSYNLETVQKMFKFTFAEKKEDVPGFEKTVEIELGMSVEEVVAIKGKPKSKINLGEKVILTYDDVKLIFEEDKLVDAQ